MAGSGADCAFEDGCERGCAAGVGGEDQDQKPKEVVSSKQGYIRFTLIKENHKRAFSRIRSAGYRSRSEDFAAIRDLALRGLTPKAQYAVRAQVWTLRNQTRHADAKRVRRCV